MINKSKAGGVFRIQCLDPNGNLKWEAESHNLVVNVGLQDMNTKYFTNSGTYNAAWYIGLIQGPSAATIAATDTLASHIGWTEFTAYTGSRKAATFGSASAADPSIIATSPAASFSITGSGDVVGAFLTNDASTNSGLLFSASNFTGGNRSVSNGDTLNVTYTFNLDAA